MSSNKQRPKCAVCEQTTYIVVSRQSPSGDIPVGYFCRHCQMLYPKKGIRPGTDKLYLGLKQVS